MSYDRARVGSWVGRRMNATGVLTRAQPTVDLDRDASIDAGTLIVTAATPVTVYTGMAMISVSRSRGANPSEAGRREADAPTTIRFPLDTDVHPGDRYTVTSVIDDPLAAGAVYVIDVVRRGTHRPVVSCDATEYRT